MTSSRVRILPVGLLAGLIASCAHAPSVATASEPIAPASETLAGMLTGRVSGVVVTANAGGGITVRISGPHSFSLSQDPLYVVDDVVVRPGRPRGPFVTPRGRGPRRSGRSPEPPPPASGGTPGPAPKRARSRLPPPPSRANPQSPPRGLRRPARRTPASPTTGPTAGSCWRAGCRG